MRKYVKRLTLLLAAALLIGSIAGCGASESASVNATSVTESGEAASETTTSKSAERAEAAASAEPAAAEDSSVEETPVNQITYPIADGAVLTSWGSINSNLINYMETLSENAVIKEAAVRTGVTLEATSISSDVVSESFALMVAAGDYTDLIDNVASFYASPDAAIEDEVIIDLAGYTEEHAPDFMATLNSNEAWKRRAYTNDGKLPFFCMLTTEPNAVQSSGYLIRQDWLDDLELDTPETFDDLYNVLSAFKSKKGASNALWLNSNGLGLLAESYGVMATYEPMGGFYPFYVKDETVYCGYFDETFKDYLAMASQWYEEGLIWKDFMTDTFCFGINTSNAVSLFTGGDMGIAYGEAKDVNSLPDMSGDPNYKLAAIPDPTNDGEANHMSAMGDGFGYKHAISTACDNPELACEYLNYFYTDEGYQLCTYGIEGEASVNGEYTELLTDNPNNLSFDNAFDIYCLYDFPCRIDGTRYLRIYDETTLAASDVWAASRDGAYNYPKGATLTADETTAFNGIFTDVNTYVQQSVLAFITGDMDIETQWDEFQSTLKDMGIDDAFDLKKTAYKRYCSK